MKPTPEYMLNGEPVQIINSWQEEDGWWVNLIDSYGVYHDHVDAGMIERIEEEEQEETTGTREEA